MNEISERLSNHMKQFAEIDKQFNQSIKDNSKANQHIENNPIPKPKLSNSKINNNQENNPSLIPSNFHKVYSDFNESTSRNSRNHNGKTYKTTNSHNDLNNNLRSPNNPPQQNSVKVLLKNPSNSSRNHLIQSHNKTNKSPIKYSTNDVGTRLYNYGYYIKNKIECIKQLKDQERQDKMTPILIKSNLNWNKLSTFISNKSLDKKINLSRQKRNELSRNSNTFRPNICKNSTSIAEKLEPSFSRLIKKKKRYSSTSNRSNSKSSIELSYDWRSISFSKTKSSKPKTSRNISKHTDQLYVQGMRNKTERINNYEENIRQKEREYQYYTFKPKITEHVNTNFEDNMRRHDQFTKQLLWKNRVEMNKINERLKKDNDEITKCTFSPNIEPLNMNNDEVFILKNVCHINEYVNKRRENIMKQKEFEEYKQKRFGHDLNYQIKMTKPQGFKSVTEQRSKKNLRCYSNEAGNNFLNPSYSPDKVIQIRESLGTDTFFQNTMNSPYNQGTINTPNSYQNHINNQYSNNNNLYLLNEVNSLHSRIDNMNL